MRAERFILLPLLLVASAALCAAQGRVAVVDTTVFHDPQKGVKRIARALEEVEREFAPRRAELAQLHERLRRQRETFSFYGPIPTDPAPVTPERRRRAKAAAGQTQLLIERKDREMRRAFDARVKEVLAPIEADIRSSLEAFARSRGVTLLLDAGKAACLLGCDDTAASPVDITRDFVNEYNRLNP